MLMIKAGPAVDAVIEELLPLLSPGDIIIDGGNTHYADTERRTKYVESKGLLFIGTGVSGGEEGALKGPSIMPGGSIKAWPAVKPIFQAIAAKVGPKEDIPCCEWVGPRGAGHYVKMVHNGIEYGDMQLISEAYFVLKEALNLSNDELYDVFDDWNRGELDSYLIEITRDIFSVKDPDTGEFLLDKIKDTAGAKGTGKWMSQLALDLGVPSTLVTEAVYARALSAAKDARVHASKVLKGPTAKFSGDRQAFIAAVRDALYASKICSYAQGFVQMAAAAKEHDWPLKFGDIALLVAGRLHHPRPLLGSHQRSLRCRSEPGKPAAGPLLSGRGRACPGGLAASHRHGGELGHLGAGRHDGAGLFRRLSPCPPAGQSVAGPARLLRRPHLRAARQAGNFPHALARTAPAAKVRLGFGWVHPPTTSRMNCTLGVPPPLLPVPLKNSGTSRIFSRGRSASWKLSPFSKIGPVSLIPPNIRVPSVWQGNQWPWSSSSKQIEFRIDVLRHPHRAGRNLAGPAKRDEQRGHVLRVARFSPTACEQLLSAHPCWPGCWSSPNRRSPRPAARRSPLSVTICLAWAMILG